MNNSVIRQTLKRADADAIIRVLSAILLGGNDDRRASDATDNYPAGVARPTAQPARSQSRKCDVVRRAA